MHGNNDAVTPYSLIRHRIQTGDLIEWRANSALGFMIRSVTGKNVNHSSSAIWDQNITGMNHTCRGDQRLYVGEAIARGYCKTYLSNELKKYDGKIYWSALKPEYDHVRLILAFNLQQLEGRPYDYMSLIRNLWRRVPLNDSELYCSEVNQIGLIRTGLLDKDYSPTGKEKHKGCGMRPGEFGDTGLFEEPIRIK